MIIVEGAIVAAMTISSPATPARAALLDAARIPLEADLGKPVKFVVDRLKIAGDHAFLLATMQDGHGKPLDYTGTRLADAAAQGFVSHRFAALLARRDGVWHVVVDAVGPTDIAWSGWAAKYKVSAALFAE